MKRSDNTEQPGWTTDPGEDFEETISADKVEGLRHIYEGHEQWLPLFPAFLLQLPEQEHHVDGRPVRSEPAL